MVTGAVVTGALTNSPRTSILSSMLAESQLLQFKEGAAVWGIQLGSETLDAFSRFADLLEDANRHLNLTRIAQADIVSLHFLDSLAMCAAITPKPGDRLIDVGSGAGFPGLPLALAFPELDVTLLDGTRKRLEFVDAVISALALPNARTLHGRAEDIGRTTAHRARYDLTTARAVAKLSVLAEWLLPLVRPGGHAMAYKSRNVDKETASAQQAIARQGGRIERIVEVTLPHTEIVRKLVVMRAQAAAPSPRPAPRRSR